MSASTESPLERIQHVLHANPILGPLAVLLLAIIAFSLVQRPVPLGGQPGPGARPGHRDRHARARSDPGHPDRRHRPVGRRDRGVLLDPDGQLRHRARLAGRRWRCSSDCARHGDGGHQRPAGHPAQTAPVHRHAGHAEHLLLAQLGGLPERDGPRLGHAGHHDLDRQHVRRRRLPAHLRVDHHAAAVRVLLLRADQHGLGQARLRHRGRHRGGPAGRHPHRPGAAVGLHGGRR